MNITQDFVRSISRQSGCEFEYLVRPSDPLQSFSVGLSGSTYLDFLVSGNRVYDNDRNFIFSLNNPSQLKLRYFINDNKAMAYVDGNLLTINTGDFSVFDYAVVQNTGNLDFDLYLSGKKPLINYSGVNDFASGVDIVTGAILNSTSQRRFRILSGDVLNPSSAGIFLSGWETGDIVTSGALYFGALSEGVERSGIADVLLYTNFGNVSIPIDLATNEVDQDAFVNIWPDNLTWIDNGFSNDYFVESYFNFGSRELEIKLEYISGLDSYEEEFLTGIGTGYLYGDITGSGILTGQISGDLGFGVFHLQDVASGVVVTGNFTGTFYTTGSGQYNSQEYTGLISTGYNLVYDNDDNGVFLATIGTGTFPIDIIDSSPGPYESFTGIIGDEFVYPYEGTLNRNVFNETITGFQFIASLSYELDSLDNFSTSIYNETSSQSCVVEFSSGDNFSGTSGSNYIYTGTVDSLVSMDASGFWHFYGYPSNFTGELVDFQINFPLFSGVTLDITGSGEFPEHYFTETFNIPFYSGLSSGYFVSTGKVPFTSVWNLKTGQYFPVIYNHKDYGWTIPSGYFHSGANALLPQSFKTNSVIEVDYSGLGTSGVNIARLSAFDGFISSVLYISGTGEIVI